MTWRERCANVGHVAGASSDKIQKSNITTDRCCILVKEKCAAKITIDKGPKKKKKKDEIKKTIRRDEKMRVANNCVVLKLDLFR